MTAGKREFDFLHAARAVIGTTIAVGILLVGTIAPQDSAAVASAQAAAQSVEGNGPTGYFPDMFVNQGTGGEPQPEAF
jgi:hypothetical protein